ncbi:MAG: TonB-dependent receptor [Dysgonamonadaceae bacterium]
MKNIYYCVILLALVCVQNAFSQSESVSLTIAGSVMDEKGEMLIGVSVSVKENPTQGEVTDMDGRFKITGVKKGSTIVFSMISYKKIEIKLNENRERERIVLQEDINKMDEVVVTAQGSQRRISVTGAISTISPKELQVPAVSVTNMLGGRVPGIIAVTRSGEPGNDFSEFWIRGISTFGANNGPLVLIDGIEGNLNNLDPADIESFSVLKDASSTAVYGVRGANGIVVVTSKRGRAGKLKFTYKSNLTYSYSAREPKYVEASTYAALANEANIVRGSNPVYSDVSIELFRSGLDPDLHPNVNWQDELLKDHTWYNQHYLSMSGGGENARYFLSCGYMDKEGIFKVDRSANKYNPNVNWKKYNVRMNIDANLTRTTSLLVGLETVITNQKAPGFGNTTALWTTQATLTPVTTPVKYSTGQLAAMGNTASDYNPYAMLNYTGLIQNYTNTTVLNIGLRQDLGFVTNGLVLDGKFSFSNYTTNTRERKKTPYLVYSNSRDRYGNLYLQPVQNSADPVFKQESTMNRRYYGEVSANYNRIFGYHRIGALALYYMDDYISSIETTDLDAIPKRYQAISGRLTYSFNDAYFAEFNAGYTGSEAFRTGEQFGFFPAFSLAWVPTQYEWVKQNLKLINFFKIRGSVGLVGNDRPAGRRFPYLTTIKQNTGSGIWNTPEGSLSEDMVGSDNLVWEKATKYNLGLDVHFFKNRFNFTIDVFKDERKGIFQQRATIPDEIGLTEMPWANVGSMKSHGFDGHLSYGQDINKDMFFMVRANYTYSKNRILNWEQPAFRYPYQSWSNTAVGEIRGLIDLGLFKNEEEIRNSPKQTFGSYTLGDIRYKDVNGDGVIDPDDEVPLGYSAIPRFQYGFAGEFRWKNWSLGLFLEGISSAKFFYGGDGYYPFVGKQKGNILTIVADPKNRWIPREYAQANGIDPSMAENPQAMFPRLTYGNSDNNNRASTFWLADAKYLRLSSVEVGYTLNGLWLKKYGMERVTFSVVGNNLAVWDNMKYWDAAQASSNGAVYPLQRTFTGQIVVNF